MYRSHTPEAIRAAQAAGKTIWKLDTGGDGRDDHLIAEAGEGEADLRAELEDWLDGPIPSHWTLRVVDWEVEDDAAGA